jgi:nucleotide-binding universal stress UspA family protein
MKEECMSGTIVCGIADSAGGWGAAELGAALSARLGLRLVLVQVIDVGASKDTWSAARAGAERRATAIAHGVGHAAETRVVGGARAGTLAQVAAEEGADLIVLGSRAAGLGRRTLRCPLARELEAATPVPVLVAPPSTRRRSGHRLAVAVETAGR